MSSFPIDKDAAFALLQRVTDSVATLYEKYAQNTTVVPFVISLNPLVSFGRFVGRAGWYSLVGAVSGAVGVCFFIAAIPYWMGFTASGVVAGSLGATLMSWHAGFVPAGGFVATMQSMGTLGWSAGFNGINFFTGFIIGGGAGSFLGIKKE